jgi:hypothetical protein
MRQESIERPFDSCLFQIVETHDFPPFFSTRDNLGAANRTLPLFPFIPSFPFFPLPPPPRVSPLVPCR